jgi:predicted GTPase
LAFFNQQQELLQKNLETRVEYVSSFECTLDALIHSVETVSPQHQWNLDEVVDTVVRFWMKNSDAVYHWKDRLQDAGRDSLLVSRVADIDALKTEFELLFEN